ncbi:MAG: LysM peptidoglycan-binding domain-containing protein [Myxococcota bacterium]
MLTSLALGSLFAVATPQPRPTPAKGTWMTHKVERGDTADSIANRWGVTRAELVKWNPWLSRTDGAIRPGKVLQLRAKARPAMRMRAIVFTVKGDTWASVADKVGTSVALLKAGPNRQYADQELRPGLSLIALRDVAKAGWNPYEGRRGEAAPPLMIESGGLSEGRPNGGRLVNGIRLPQTDLYDLWKPEQCYGSTHAVQTVVAAIGSFRERTGWEGRLTIGSMSREGGGHFAPHKSHRSGRDVDIRLPRLDGSGTHPRHDEVDWHATWALISAFIDTEQTEAIFLSRRLHPLLRRAGKDMGATPQELAAIGTVVVHSKGHHAHIHVRVRCGIDETDCKGVGSVHRSIKVSRRSPMTRAR